MEVLWVLDRFGYLLGRAVAVSRVVHLSGKWQPSRAILSILSANLSANSRTINIGPIRPNMNGYVPVMKSQLDYNPRCQRRDLTIQAAARFTPEALFDLLAGDHSHSIGQFQDEFQGAFGVLRMHGAGHYCMGGDASDVFSSINDPAFYQHHAMVDRVYWMWQALHPQQANTINGTRTFRDTPPSANATIDDPLNVGVLGPHLPIKDMFDTLGNSPLCYIYE